MAHGALAAGRPAAASAATSATARVHRRHHLRPAWAVAFAVVAAGTVAATVLVLQNLVTNPSAKAPAVVFQTGTDYAAINTAGFATLTVGTSGTSATLAVSGIAGASSVSLTNVAKLTDSSATQAYTVTLSRSAAPNAAITSFVVTVKNGATTLATWDAVAAASSSPFTLPVSTSLDVSVLLVIADGTATGALGSFTIQHSLVPA